MRHVFLTPEKNGVRSLTGFSVFCFVFLLSVLSLFLHGFSFFSVSAQGRLVDIDSYMVIDVLSAWHHGAPYGLLPRLMEPGGTYIHWARCYPMMIAGLAWLIRFFVPVLSYNFSCLYAGLFIGNMSFVVTVWALLWGCLSSKVVIPKKMMLFLATLCVFGPLSWHYYSGPSVITHHLSMTMFVSLGFMAFFRQWPVLWSVIFSVLSLWVSPEVFPFLLLIFALYLVRNIRDASLYSGLSCVFVLLLSYFDPPPAKYGLWMPDHISLVYVLMWAWCCVASLCARFSCVQPPLYRLLISAVSLVVWLLTTPMLRFGIHALISPSLMTLWYNDIDEIRHPPFDLLGFSLLIFPVFLFIMSLFLFLRRPFAKSDFWSSPVFWELAVLWGGLLFTWGMSLHHARSIVFLDLMGILVLVRCFSEEAVFAFESRFFKRFLGITTFLCFFFFGVMDLLAPDANKWRSVFPDPVHAAQDLAHEPGPSLVFMDWVPNILFYSEDASYRVVTAPYHRNQFGLQFYYDVMLDTSPGYQKAHALLDSLGIKSVVMNKMFLLSRLNVSLPKQDRLPWKPFTSVEESHRFADAIAHRISMREKSLNFVDCLAVDCPIPFLTFKKTDDNLSIYAVHEVSADKKEGGR